MQSHTGWSAQGEEKGDRKISGLEINGVIDIRRRNIGDGPTCRDGDNNFINGRGRKGFGIEGVSKIRKHSLDRVVGNNISIGSR
jgi:hypothetical protein